MFSLLKQLNLPLGRWFGIPVGLHWTWVAIFTLVLWIDVTAAITYAAIFAIVLLHEFGHCLAGRWYGMYARSIVLYPIGGVARLELPTKPVHELVIALAGPMVNVLLIPVFLLVQHYYSDPQLDQVASINLILFLFNMIPAYPMDGGRVLRAGLAMALHDYERATIIAGRVGQCFGLLFVAGAFYVGNIWLILIGAFVMLHSQRDIDICLELQWMRNLHECVTGTKTPPPIENNLADSVRMIEEIQRKLAKIPKDE